MFPSPCWAKARKPLRGTLLDRLRLLLLLLLLLLDRALPILVGDNASVNDRFFLALSGQSSDVSCLVMLLPLGLTPLAFPSLGAISDFATLKLPNRSEPCSFLGLVAFFLGGMIWSNAMRWLSSNSDEILY